MQGQVTIENLRVLIEMVNAIDVEQRYAALDAVHYIALAEQEFSELAPPWLVIPIIRTASCMDGG